MNACWKTPEDNKQWFSQEGEEEATQHSDLNWRQGRPRPATPALAQSANRAVAARFEGPADLFQLGNIVPGVFTPVLAKHTKQISLGDVLSIGNRSDSAEFRADTETGRGLL
ncbi:MAG TPA: hypothetical protein VF860_11295 [Candidatus Acidoferrales bacterium]